MSTGAHGRVWLGASLAVFVVQSHCGVPGVDHERLAVHFLDRGQHERALREARRAAREAPDEAQPRVIQALAHAGMGDLLAAVAALERALVADPDDSRLYGALRSLCGEAGREDLALAALERLAGQHPGRWQLDANLGWAHRALGHGEAALEALERAVADEDTTAPVADRVFAHFQLSRLYAEAERFDAAARVLEEALLLAPEDARLLVGTGECRLRAGSRQAAEGYFERALEETDDVTGTAARIAQVFYNAGHKGDAIRYYELAAHQRQATPLVMNNLAWTYAEEGTQLERAHELSLKAVKSDADNVVYLDTYAEVLYRLGRRDQAVALMRHCLEIEPEGGEHHAYLQGQLTRFRDALPDSAL